MSANVAILKDGNTELEALVQVTMACLKNLFKRNPFIFYEFVMKCRDKNHRFFGSSEETLRELSLVEAGGSVHDSIRHIVLSAVTGEGMDMTLGSPIKE